MLKLHEHRGGYWRKKLQWTILEEQFPLPQNTAAGKIGNGAIFAKGIWHLLKQIGGTGKPPQKISNLNYNGSSVEKIADIFNWTASLSILLQV